MFIQTAERIEKAWICPPKSKSICRTFYPFLLCGVCSIEAKGQEMSEAKKCWIKRISERLSCLCSSSVTCFLFTSLRSKT